MIQDEIIIKPLITEKSMQDAAFGKFTFVVAKTANKEAIKKAISEKFNVHVIAVATSIMKGRQKRVGKRRTQTTESSWKKAIAKVKKGEKIDLFDVGEKK